MFVVLLFHSTFDEVKIAPAHIALGHEPRKTKLHLSEERQARTARPKKHQGGFFVALGHTTKAMKFDCSTKFGPATSCLEHRIRGLEIESLLLRFIEIL